MLFRILVFFISWLIVQNGQAQSPVQVQLTPFANGFNQITDVAHAGDDRLFVTQQAGLIRIVAANGSILPAPFLSISVQSGGNEQGLLGLAFDPDYSTNGYFYVNYTLGSGAGSTRISRYTVSADPDVADPTSEEILYTVQQPATNHNGGDLEFGPDGFLYIGFGDGGGAGDTQNNSQNMGVALGKMLRIDVHSASPYAIPPDNPFIGIPGALPEIWALGLRNPWRYGFDALTGDLWIGDVGQNAWEEVDYWPAGDNSGPNFGWRCYEGNATYNSNGCQPASAYEFPVEVHVNNASQWCSVIGGRVYRTEQYYRLKGRYIYTDYCYGRIFSLHPDEFGGWTGEQLTPTGTFGLTVIAENSSGDLFAGNRSNGILYRIEDICPMAQPVVSQTGSTLTSTNALGYAWYFNGNVIPGENGQSIDILQDGEYYVVANMGPNCQLASATEEYIVSSIQDQDRSMILVHPNPASDLLIIERLPASVIYLTMVDMAGRQVRSIPTSSASGRVLIDTSDLSAGQYAIMLYASDGAGAMLRTISIQR